eukprot:TRINITY_DN12773_c0_g1_i1.p1 TRINITY_DN12773_c0_g1~~TRINITY_DN12773_c0_g1_i1.p1  ORF type:complete len:194 (+),score=38.61 TRINITY_DN12773_c0_g1_i1:71-652(+)
MDSIIGFVGKDYVLIAADTMQTRSIVVMKNNLDKVLVLDEYKLLSCVDLSAGDRDHFSDYIQRNLHFYELKNDKKLSTNATANYTRRELANALRSRNPYNVNILLGGVDKGIPSLYYIDYLASSNKLNFGAHGYCSYFVLSIFDKYWKSDMSLEEGKQLLKRIIEEIHKRFSFNQANFTVKIVDKDGAREIKL